MIDELVGVSYTEDISMQEKIKKIHELIKETCPDAVAVRIFVNSRGMDFMPEYRESIKGYNMETINGKMIKKQGE